jgi:hypothetical protein
MRLGVTASILADPFRSRSLKEIYWAADQNRVRLSRLLRGENRAFRTLFLRDLTQFLFGMTHPIPGETRERIIAAVDWILLAQDASGDGGVSLGYFPCDEQSGWKVSYPETTGYIITSLLEYASRFGEHAVRERALRMARWETEIQMASGAVQGGPVCPPDKQTPTAFNTGMVLDGWTSAYKLTRDPLILEAGKRAANWLVNDLTDEGYFRTNGKFVAPDVIKTYNSLCAWALYRFAEFVPDSSYCDAALTIIDAALRQQKPNGWFANNCLSRPEAPLLHTIGYTLQGTLEVGILAGRATYVEAVSRGVTPLLERITKRGLLPGQFFSDWSPACFSSCLTGSAQLAIVCYRMFEHTGHRTYFVGAEKLLNGLKALQRLSLPNPALNGALSGSFPLFGTYMTAGYPNWATKYFLDALLLQDRLGIS